MPLKSSSPNGSTSFLPCQGSIFQPDRAVVGGDPDHPLERELLAHEVGTFVLLEDLRLEAAGAAEFAAAF